MRGWIVCVLLIAFCTLAGCQTTSPPHIRNEVVTKTEQELMKMLKDSLPILRESSEGLGWHEVHSPWPQDDAVFQDPALSLAAQKAAEERYLEILRRITGHIENMVHDYAAESKDVNTYDPPERWQTE